VPIESDVAYLDASALIKLVVAEDESRALQHALRTWRRRVTSRIGVVEVLRVVRRRDPDAEPFARRVLAHVSLLAIGDRVLVAAAALEPRSLRSLDAIHVASAMRVRPILGAFVSYDARQLEAAEALGLPVVSPR
jgi:predicted nucleic acid-binding protein